MFGFFKRNNGGAKPIRNRISVMGHDVDLMMAIVDGEVIYLSPELEHGDRNEFHGSVFEVALRRTEASPILLYYRCNDYYVAVVTGMSAEFGGPQGTSTFRSVVSQNLSVLLGQILRQRGQLDLMRNVVSFSHNQKHTNVLSYVERLGQWYPIQAHEGEHEEAAIHKVRQVNASQRNITDVIAINDLSPSD